MFFWFIAIAIVLVVLSSLLRQILTFKLPIKAIYLALFLILFLALVFGGYFIKANRDSLYYSYARQQQEKRQFVNKLIKLSAQTLACGHYKEAETNYDMLIKLGEDKSNIFVGYVLAQLAQNNINIEEQKAFLTHAIALNPFDLYARILLKKIETEYANK